MHSLDLVRSRFTRAHPLEPELLPAIRHLSIFKRNSYKIKCFFEATDLHFNLFCTANRDPL